MILRNERKSEIGINEDVIAVEIIRKAPSQEGNGRICCRPSLPASCPARQLSARCATLVGSQRKLLDGNKAVADGINLLSLCCSRGAESEILFLTLGNDNSISSQLLVSEHEASSSRMDLSQLTIVAVVVVCGDLQPASSESRLQVS